MDTDLERETSADLFERIAEQIDHVLWMVAFDPPRPVYVSAAFERISGIPLRALYDDPEVIFRSVHPDDVDRVRRAFIDWTRDPGSTFSVDYRIVRADGAVRWIRTRGTGTHGQGWVSGVSEDITERRAAEDRLTFQANALAQISDAIMALDRDFRVTFWNRAAERLSGISASEVIGLLITELSPRWVDDDVSRRAICREVEAGRVWRGETAYVSRDGRSMQLECTVSLLRSGESTGGFLAVIRDVTDARRTRDDLEASNRRMSQLLTAAPSVLYAVAPSRPARVTFLGANVERLLGFPPSAFLSDPHFWRSRLHPSDIEGTRVAFKQLLESGHIVHEYRFQHQDGSWHWMRDEAQVTRDETGSPQEVIGFWTDITENKRLERELRQAQKLEALGAFAGGIAHDFNNLLMGITGCADVALRQLDDDHGARRFVAELKRAARSGSQVVSQLLAFSRQREVEPKLVALHDVVADAQKMLRHLLGEDVDLRIHHDGARDMVRCDPGQVQQILMNLVANARHAMPHGGLLEIGVANTRVGAGEHPTLPEGEYVTLCVADAGVGMDEETLAHVFEPFFTTREAQGGTGLGLATVYGIVKQAGGHIDVRSEPERGTTFKIYLPRASGTTVEMPAVTVPEPPPGDVTVLVVEDEPLVRLTIRHYLEGAGYRVLEAADGERAVRVCRDYDGDIGLLITDIVLPGEPGPQVARAVARLRPDVRTIFVSAYPREKLMRDGRLSAGQYSLEKPFSEEELLAMAYQALAPGPGRYPTA